MARTAAPRNNQSFQPTACSTPAARRRRISADSRGGKLPSKTRTRARSLVGRAGVPSPAAGTRKRRIPDTVTIEVVQSDDRAKMSRERSENSGGQDDLFKKMTEYMDRKFSGTDTKVDGLSAKIDSVSGTVSSLSTKVDAHGDQIAKINTEIAILKAAPVDGVKRQVQKVIQDMGATAEGMGGPTRGEINRLDSEIEKLKESQHTSQGDDESKYWRARRAIRIWPVVGSTNKEIWAATGNFFYSILRIPEGVLEEKAVESIRRVCPTNRNRKRGHRVHDEVVVHLRDVETRDMIQSYATNLADHRGEAGLRMEVPCHLTGKFKCLERLGNILKRKHGRSLRWHINFDDVKQLLCLSIRLPDSDEWDRLDFESARDELQRLEGPGLASMRNRIGSSLSTGSSSGEDSPDVEMIAEARPPLPTSSTLEKFKKKPAWGSQK